MNVVLSFKLLAWTMVFVLFIVRVYNRSEDHWHFSLAPNKWTSPSSKDPDEALNCLHARIQKVLSEEV